MILLKWITFTLLQTFTERQPIGVPKRSYDIWPNRTTLQNQFYLVSVLFKLIAQKNSQDKKLAEDAKTVLKILKDNGVEL